jgi:hypothetical protein
MSSFDWDPDKAAANVRRHGITFEEADSVAASPLSLDELDTAHSSEGERVKIIGWSSTGRLLVVIVSEADDPSRIISARRATKRERHAYTK